MTETSAATPADDPLDRDYLQRNYLSLGCADVLADVVTMYLDSAPEKLAELRAALAAGQMEAAAKLAHGLKGESGSVAARQVVALSASIEQSARQGDLAACTTALPDLELALTRAMDILKQEFSV